MASRANPRRITIKERADIITWMQTNRARFTTMTMKEIREEFVAAHPQIEISVETLRMHFTELGFEYCKKASAVQGVLVGRAAAPVLALALLALMQDIIPREHKAIKIKLAEIVRRDGGELPPGIEDPETPLGTMVP